MIIEMQYGVFAQESTYQQSTVWNYSVVSVAVISAAANVLYQEVYQRVFQRVYQPVYGDRRD